MSVSFFGDFDTTETVTIPFNTFDSNDPSASVTATNLANTDVHIHKDGSLTQRSSSAGVTVDIDVDGIVGCHWVNIDLSDNTDAGFYANGSQIAVRVEGVTVDAGTINPWIGAYTIGRTLRPTTAGRKLDVTATGGAGIDWANVENSTTSLDLSGTDIQLADTVTTLTGHTAQTGDNFTRIGAAGAGLTAINLPNQTMDITGDITGNLSGSVGSVTTVSDKTGYSLAATGLDAIGQAATGMVEIAKAVWDRVLSGATHNITNSAGRRLRQIEASFVVAAGTAQAGAAGTITLAAGESATDNIFRGDRIIIVEGTGKSEHGLVTAYNGTTKVAAMSENWVITPDATSEYELVPADCDVETWQHVVVTASATTNLPEVDAKSISDDATAADNLELDYDGTGLVRANSTIGTVTANSDMRGTDSAALASVATEARLAELDAGNIPTDLTDIQGATFSGATDSLEAIRNRGDAAWTTGAGGSPPQLMQSTTIATLASQTSFTLTAGSADDDAYNGAIAKVTDASTAVQQAYATISDYTGSSLTVTLSADPAVFTMAIGDTIDIMTPLGAAGSAPTVAQIADGVWDETQSSHTGAGTFGEIATETAAILVDTADIQPKLGTPAADVSADIAAVKVDTAATLVDTADMQPKLGTPAADVSADIAAVKVDTAATLVDTGTTLPATLATIDGNVDAILVDTGTTIPASIAALNDLSVADILTTQMTEAYAADGVAPTLAQAIFAIQQQAGDFSIAGTTITVKKLDGTTTAMTFTLDDGTDPTSRTRAT